MTYRLRSMALTDTPYTFWEQTFTSRADALREFLACAEHAKRSGGKYVLSGPKGPLLKVERFAGSE